MLIYTVIILLVCLGIIAGSIVLSKISLKSAAGGKAKEVKNAIEETDGILTDFLRYKDSYASKEQFATLVKLANDALAELEKEKSSLQEIENKLDTSQKAVEQREIEQQDLKTAQETSEEKLDELMASFSSVSEEATKLEAQLAEALKALDNIQSTVDITPDQKATIDELTAALEEAGSLLRDLLMEYQALNERLELLKTQHEDLEDEYTRLVEQQLGEL